MSRFHLVEYGPPVALLPDLAAALGAGTAEAARVLSEAGNRVARQVGLKDAPIELNGGLVSSHSIAGLLRLGRSSELEISPKFLGSHADGTGWQQDFFFLAMLSKHGHLLTSDRIRSRPGESNDLDVLLARAIHDMYTEQQHRPIRSYQRTTEHDFFLDGDVDPFDLKMPDARGYPQEVIRFNRANRYNAIISAAAQVTRRHIKRPAENIQLGQLMGHLGHQPRIPGGSLSRVTVPGRSRSWQPLVDLSIDVINGSGMTFNEGGGRSPGFVVSTWQLWQDLLTISLRLAYGAIRAKPEPQLVLGSRHRVNGTKGRLNVHPDVSAVTNSGVAVLVDAKYKGRVDRKKGYASEADVYESMAFSQASGGLPVVLAYPRLASAPLCQVGHVELLERVEVPGSGDIFAVAVEVRGIAARNAFATFVASFGRGLDDIVGPALSGG